MIVGAALAGRALPRRALRATILSNLRAPHPRIARAFSAVNPNVNGGAGSQGAANGRASLIARGAALAALGLGLYGLSQSQATQQEQKHKPLYPEFSKEEVRKHNKKESRIWVTYQGWVYDITEFTENHPGGSKILLAAGGPLEPFWNLYAVHQNAEVYQLLAPMRIGKLKASDQAAASNLSDPYANDPDRHPALKVNSQKPFNAEPPSELLTDSFITPNELFFKRNHLPVPDIKADDYVLTVEVEGLSKPLKLTLNDLQTKFDKVSVVSTLQCAGNRRAEMHNVKHVKGLSWTGNAISNAEWTGVRLRDVLLKAGVKERFEDQALQHVQFEGLDKDLTNQNYGASVPIDKAMSPRGDVILAFEMNGKPLPRDHGFPVRVIVPGCVAARQVKWLGKVLASKTESQNFWQQKDYKSFSPSVDWHNVDFGTAPAIQETPVQSMITQVEGLEHGGPVTIKGFAYSGGGRGVIRVDVSVDGGKTWEVAHIKHGAAPPGNYSRNWTWALWELEVPLEALRGKEEGQGQVEIVAKATDTSYNVQPERIEPYWNLRGVMTNHWPRFTVEMPQPTAQEAAAVAAH